MIWLFWLPCFYGIYLRSPYCAYIMGQADNNESSLVPGNQTVSDFRSCPKLITRAEWNARPPKSVAQMRLPVKFSVIHHSVMGDGNCSTTVECIQVVQSIQTFHMDVRGWDDIGYSFLIGGDGNVYEGRGWNKTGAHAPGYNDKSIGICLIGNFMEHLPTESQLNAAKNLIACGVSRDLITNDYQLYGHRDVRKNTLCPGDRFYEEISKWPHKAPALVEKY